LIAIVVLPAAPPFWLTIETTLAGTETDGIAPETSRSPVIGRTSQSDPELTFLTAPAGEPRCRKANDEVPCDRAVTMGA
jgi:hypothetical protein